MYNFKKSLSLLLVLTMMFTTSFSSFATKVSTHTTAETVIIHGNEITLEEFQEILEKYELKEIKSSSQNLNLKTSNTNMYTRSVAYSTPTELRYEIFGFVVIVVIGAYVIIQDNVYDASTSIYRSVMKAIENKYDGKVVDVDGRKSWSDGKSEQEILDKVNGKKGKTREGVKGDGMDLTPVYDKKTGKRIGEIHEQQPEYRYGKGQEIPTGKVFPPHYHDKANRLGKGKSHHWHW
tara:strand:- start:963 stop:1667 length:705 start_codon:yes stop_codon:yes gene_type:complete